MKKWIWIIESVFLVGLSACAQTEEGAVTPKSGNYPLALALEGYGHVDSAQVFFFRKSNNRDSLVVKEIIYDITTAARRFDFDLPLGDYFMVIMGNVATDRIKMRPPYSSGSVFIDYQGERQMPAIYWGNRYMTVGVDSVGLSGMLLFTAAVEVTVRHVPAGISRIDVEVTNTCAAASLRPRLVEKPMDPPIGTTLYHPVADSSYKVELSSLPSVGVSGQSTVVVRCYDATGKNVYRGESVAFPSQQGRRRVVACNFQTPSKLPVKSGTLYSDIQLMWEYEVR